MSFERVDDRNMVIRGPQRGFRFEIVEGNAAIDAAEPRSPVRNVFPSVRARPILMHVRSPEQALTQTVTWRFRIVT